MNCQFCGLPMSRTRCGLNSRWVCRRGHQQSDPTPLRTNPTDNLSDWAWAEWVQEQGIGE